MKKSTSIILLVGFLLIIVGGALAVGSYFVGGATTLFLTRGGIEIPKKMNPKPYTKEVDAFKNITVENGDQSVDVDIKVGDTYRVEYRPAGNDRYVHEDETFDSSEIFSLEGDTLTVKPAGYLAPFSSEGIQLMSGIGQALDFGPDKIAITVPADTTLDSIAADGGAEDLNISGVSARTGHFKLISGSLFLDNSEFASLEITNEYGDTALDTVVVSGATSFDAVAGAIEITSSKFGTIDATTNAGDFNLTNTIIAQGFTYKGGSGGLYVSAGSCTNPAITLDSGDVELEGELLGRISVTSVSGGIEIDPLLPANYYNLDVATESGSIEINEAEYFGNKTIENGAPNTIEARATYGDIDISFR